MPPARPFHPNDSRVGLNALADFIRAPLPSRLEALPGVGPATAALFQRAGVSTPYQLVAMYLSFKAEAVSPVQHAERFYRWVVDCGVGSYRAGIVHSICEKTNHHFPGLYDASAYASAQLDNEVDA